MAWSGVTDGDRGGGVVCGSGGIAGRVLSAWRMRCVVCCSVPVGGVLPRRASLRRHQRGPPSRLVGRATPPPGPSTNQSLLATSRNPGHEDHDLQLEYQTGSQRSSPRCVIRAERIRAREPLERGQHDLHVHRLTRQARLRRTTPPCRGQGQTLLETALGCGM